jgi:serine/threonine-protein kinase
VPAAQRADPSSSYQRFAHLPSEDLLTIFDTFIDLHRELAALGWIAGDLYDGCLIVDFSTLHLRVIDLDSYRRGPSVNDMGQMFGSTRFMAPEEFELGATLDQRTTVFNLGRHVWHFATRLTEKPEHFCGPPQVAAVVQRAVRTPPQDRYPTVAAFADA